MPLSIDERLLPYIRVETGRDHSLSDLHNVISELPGELRDIAASVDIDVRRNTVVVGLSEQASSTIADTATASWLSSHRDVVAIEIADAPADAATLNGGLAMTSCTAGFKVQKTDGTRGMSTAAVPASTATNCTINQSFVTFTSSTYFSNISISISTS